MKPGILDQCLSNTPNHLWNVFSIWIFNCWPNDFGLEIKIKIHTCSPLYRIKYFKENNSTVLNILLIDFLNYIEIKKYSGLSRSLLFLLIQSFFFKYTVSNDLGNGERGPDLRLSSAIDFLLVLITSFYPLSIFLYHALRSKIVPYPLASCWVQPIQCKVNVIHFTCSFWNCCSW